MAVISIKSSESTQLVIPKMLVSENTRDKESTDRELQKALRRLAEAQARGQSDQL